jgi:glycosyltransferase involved in cell wall biosynthesis
VNVVIFCEDYFPHIGGIATHVHELAVALNQSGNFAEIITTRKLPPGRNLICWRVKKLVRDGVIVHEIPVMYSPRNCLLQFQQRFRFAGYVRRRIRKIGAEVFHWHNIYFDPAVAKYVNGAAAMVFTNHSSQFLAGVQNAGKALEILSYFSFAHQLIAPSQELLDESFRIGFPQDLGTYVPNGVDIACFSADQDHRIEVRERLAVPLCQIVIFCPRRIVPKNGIRYFAESLLLLTGQIPVTILFSGFSGELMWRDYPYEKEVMTILSAAGPHIDIRCLGQIPNSEMLDYYRASDIAVLPSLVEATSISGLEAMACGLPLIGTTVGGIPDLIEDSVTGILVPPADPVALADALKRLIGDPGLRAVMGQNARDKVVRQFSWKIIADKTIDVYRKAQNILHNNGRIAEI